MEEDKCQHQGLTLVKSPMFGWYLWCPGCHDCWPPSGMERHFGYQWTTRKQAERFAKNRRMEIVNFLDQTPKDKRKNVKKD